LNNIHIHPNSWLAPQLESRVYPEKGGHGVFANQHIPKGTLLAMFGGTVVDSHQLEAVPEDQKSLSIQVEDDLFLVTTVAGSGDYFNHSCDPNAGLCGQIGVVAMRDIEPDEEVTFDYAMCDSVPYDEFDCMCETKQCRGQVTGNDWQNPDLWVKYEGYFSPYLQRKIDSLRVQSNGKAYADMKRHKS
jgi:hypothetical protein